MTSVNDVRIASVNLISSGCCSYDRMYGHFSLQERQAVRASAAAPQASSSQPAQPRQGTLVWYKHDLRLDDHPGWHQALAAGQQAAAVVPVFCFDPARYAQLVLPPGGAEGARWRWGGTGSRLAGLPVQLSMHVCYNGFAAHLLWRRGSLACMFRFQLMHASLAMTVQPIPAHPTGLTLSPHSPGARADLP